MKQRGHQHTPELRYGLADRVRARSEVLIAVPDSVIGMHRPDRHRGGGGGACYLRQTRLWQPWRRSHLDGTRLFITTNRMFLPAEFW